MLGAGCFYFIACPVKPIRKGADLLHTHTSSTHEKKVCDVGCVVETASPDSVEKIKKMGFQKPNFGTDQIRQRPCHVWLAGVTGGSLLETREYIGRERGMGGMEYLFCSDCEMR